MATDIQVARLVASLVADTSDFGKGLEGAVKDAKSWGARIQDVGKIALGAVTAGAVAAAAAVGGAAAALGKMAIEAAPLEGIGIAFNKMADRVGLSLDTMREAAAGTISDFELMRSANVALTGAGEGLGKAFGENLPALLETARAAARATGQDVDFLFSSLVGGVKRSSPMLIDNTGLVLKLGEANEAMAAEVGKAVEDLTAEEKQIALLQATVLAGRKMVDEFGGGQATAAEQMAQFGAQIQNTKDSIGIALLPILQKFMGILSNLFSKIGPQVVRWVEKAVKVFGSLWEYLEFVVETGDWLNDSLMDMPEPIREVVKTIGKFVAAIRGIVQYFAFFIETGDWLNDSLMDIPEPIRGIVKAIGKFISEAAPVVERIIDWIAENVELKDVLIALGIAVAAVVIPAIITLVSTIAPIVAAVVGLIAVVALLRSAWENDFLGIRTALIEFWEGTAKPALTQLWAWLQVNIPAAIETLKNFWDTVLVPAMQRVGAAIGVLVAFWKNTLLPALQLIWSFIQENVMPVFAAWAELVTAIVILAFTALAALWENVLYPILERVWKFIQDKVVPIFTILAGAAKDELGPPLEFLAEKVLPALEKAFRAVKSIIESAIEFVYGLVNAIKEIDLPHWLEPGSPTPFEYALRGIASAMHDVALGADVMGASLMMASPAGLGGGGIDNRSYGGDTFYSTFNNAEAGALFAALVEERRRNRLNEYMGVG